MVEVSVGPPVISNHFNEEVIVSALNAQLSSDEEQGYFCSDTRLVSGYRLKLGSVHPILLNSAAIADHSARFEFTNPEFSGTEGSSISPNSLHLRLDRTLGPGLHEDYDLTNHNRTAVELSLEVSLESDFADLFDVKAHRRLCRGSIHTTWDQVARRLTSTYTNGTFERAIIVEIANSNVEPEFANGGIRFRVALGPKESWHSCIFWKPVIDGAEAEIERPCHQLIEDEADGDPLRISWIAGATTYETSNAAVTTALRQAVDDLAGLRLHRHNEQARGDGDGDAWVAAAGIPWFVSLFGRDSLTVAFQTLALSPRFALGALHALGVLQADSYDDARDMQPGKIEHEVRHGELAALHLIPHTPYYGTHEATTLYVLVAAEAWGWHGDMRALARVRRHVERAIQWIDRDGDIDGDGLQEYQTRAPNGYYNQGWKDSGNAILTGEGDLARLPIALCEHQGLVVAAKRAWAGVLEEAFGEDEQASELRKQADALAEQIEERFWWEAEGTYYLGLDGDKRPIESVASNPGHLLWQQAIDRERAKQVVERLLAEDMWSGWGIRTLSADHVAYDPLSYQLGSVWPHDNAIIAAGFRAYGHDAAAAKVAKAIFEATTKFASQRPPELFAGFPRDRGAFPVQYLGANVPQAWSSGAIIHLVTTFLGLDADAKRRCLRLAPALPDWLSTVTLHGLRVGEMSADLRVRRNHDGTQELDVLAERGGLEIDFIEDRRPLLRRT